MHFHLLTGRAVLTTVTLLTTAALTATTGSAAEADTPAVIENSFLVCTAEQDAKSPEYLRFGLETRAGNLAQEDDNNRALLYRQFYTGYTTVSINDTAYVYGTGADTDKPTSSGSMHRSSQRFENIEIRQELSFGHGLTTAYDDMLRVSYTVINKGEASRVGIRILLDPMLDEEDGSALQIHGISVTNESDFQHDLPAVWSLQSSKTGVQAYGRSDESNPPDRMLFANWNSLYDNRWDYNIRPEQTVSDSGIAFYAEPRRLTNGESFTFTVYYGVGNMIKTEESEISAEASSIPSESSAALAELSDVTPSTQESQTHPSAMEASATEQSALSDQPETTAADKSQTSSVTPSSNDSVGTGNSLRALWTTIGIALLSFVVIIIARRAKQHEA